MILLGLLLFVVPIVLPIVSLISLGHVRGRLDWLEEKVLEQANTIRELTRRLSEPTQESPAAAPPPPVEAPVPPSAAAIPTGPVAPEPPPASAPARVDVPPRSTERPRVPERRAAES